MRKVRARRNSRPICRWLARSSRPALRPCAIFSYVAPEIPEYIPENCTGCMDCVTECPDTAILGKVIAEPDLESKLTEIDDADDRAMFGEQWSTPRKYYDGPKKKGKEGGKLRSSSTPANAKGVPNV